MLEVASYSRPESPIKFFINYALVGLFFVAFIFMSILGSFGRMGT